MTGQEDLEYELLSLLDKHGWTGVLGVLANFCENSTVQLLLEDAHAAAVLDVRTRDSAGDA